MSDQIQQTPAFSAAIKELRRHLGVLGSWTSNPGDWRTGNKYVWSPGTATYAPTAEQIAEQEGVRAG